MRVEAASVLGERRLNPRPLDRPAERLLCRGMDDEAGPSRRFRDDLAARLGIVSRGLSTRGTVQILAGVLLQVQDGRRRQERRACALVDESGRHAGSIRSRPESGAPQAG
jgi:hypothetical protein